MDDQERISPSDATRAFLRHTVATIAYRGGRILRGAPAGFGDARAADPASGSRTAAGILAHIGDLLDWTAGLAAGRREWRASAPGDWEHEVGRFYSGLQAVDAALLAGADPAIPMERIFQGPIADVFTHLGQLAMLRRIAGSPIRGEVLILSDIVPGRVGPEQSAPVREFD